MTDSSQALLEVDDLTVDYHVGSRKPAFRAVDGVSLTIAPKETLGLVGESGSGKSTIGRAVLGLVGVSGGTVRFAGRDITGALQRTAPAERHAPGGLSGSLQVA